MFGDDFEALKLDEYTLFREQVSAWPMNWKFPVDSFLETYHVPTLHRRSVAPFYYATPVLFDARGWNARMCQWRRSTPDSLTEIATDEQFREHGNLIFFLFPNVILNFPTPGCLEFWHMMPDGPDRVRVTTRFYTNRAVASPRAFDFCNKNFELSNGVVYNEDFPLHLAVHKSTVAGAVKRVLYGRNEPGLIHFHRHLARRLRTEHG
jgi:phenylpropionate dioxygenase-like ring-hydroxylating dioxygenase large terminal subunit